MSGRGGARVGVTFDTHFIVDLLRGKADAARKAKEIESGGRARFLAAPVVYEIASGLLYQRSRTQAAAFRALAANFAALPFDAAAAQRAAEIRAELKGMGRPKAHVDVMIAGTALAGGHSLVTRDGDFAKIAGAFGLRVERY